MSAFTSPRIRRLLPVLALVVVSIAPFAQVRSHAFLLNWDDLDYVVGNETIRGLTWEHVRAAFAAPHVQNYAPLHLVSYAIDYSLWGLDAGAFLLTNVLVHTASGVLLFALLRRLGLSQLGAFAGAALFVVHPVQVESVAWVSERKNVLCMALSLGAVHAFLSYRLAGTSRARWAWYAAALALAVAALLTKVAAVILPLTLLLVDVCWIEAPRRRRWILDKVPFAIASLALAVVTVASQGTAVAEGRAVFQMSPATTAYTMTVVVARYLGMLFWPASLSAMYTPAIREAPDAAFLGAALLLVALVVLGVVLWARARREFCWYAVFFVGLLPVLHVVPLPTLMNDRYLYFPMVGAAGLAASGFDRWFATAGPTRRSAGLAACGAALLALAVASFERAGAWRDDISLWQDVTEKTPRATLAWVGLGMAYVDAGRLPEAIAAYRRALAEDPFYVLALSNLGASYNQLGRPADARPLLLRAIQVEPESFNAQMNLGVSCSMTGDVACAERAFRTAATLRPGAPEPLAHLRNLGAMPERRTDP